MPGVVSLLNCANSGDGPHVRAYPILRTSACRRTTAIRGVAWLCQAVADDAGKLIEEAGPELFNKD
jgi:hypothetical protein